MTTRNLLGLSVTSGDKILHIAKSQDETGVKVAIVDTTNRTTETIYIQNRVWDTFMLRLNKLAILNDFVDVE